MLQYVDEQWARQQSRTREENVHDSKGLNDLLSSFRTLSRHADQAIKQAESESNEETEQP